MGYNFKVGDAVYDTDIHKKGIVSEIVLDGTPYPVKVSYDCATLWYSLDGKSNLSRKQSLHAASDCEFDSDGNFQRVVGQLSFDDWYMMDFPELNQPTYSDNTYWDNSLYPKSKARACSCSTTELVQSGCKCGAFKAELEQRKAK